MMLLFGVVSYKMRPPRLVSYACLYTAHVGLVNANSQLFSVDFFCKIVCQEVENLSIEVAKLTFFVSFSVDCLEIDVFSNI